MSSKGQISSLDIVLSLSIFIVLMITVLLVWSKYGSRLRDIDTYNDIELAATQVSDLLVKTPGVPDDWEKRNNATILVMGLASEDRVISPDKMQAFANLTYNKTKEIMNIERFEYYLLLSQNNQSLFELGNFSAKRSAGVTRFVMYLGKPSVMELIVHE